MNDTSTYKIVEIVGSSPAGITEAMQNGVARAGKTLRNVGWVEVTQIRGHVVDGRLEHFQVGMKVGFTLDD